MLLLPEDAVAGLAAAEEPARLAPAAVAYRALAAAEQMVAGLGFADDSPAVEARVDSAASGCGLAYLPDVLARTQNH
jgi:hypothetical protein